MRGGLKDRAAAAYEKGGELETAAKLYEELGHKAKAADLFGRAGFTFKSGEAAAEAGDAERAIPLLQQVPPEDENYRAATELLARLFIETGRPALAQARVQTALAGAPVSGATLDLHYWLARTHEASSDAPAAVSLYKKIQAESLGFRDVNERVARLESGVPRSAAPAPTRNPSAAPAAAAAAPGSAAPAARPPRFVPREEIGRGPLGVVHRGEEVTDGRNVAMRMLPAAMIAAPDVLRALVPELRAASQISHPNLVKVIAFMQLKGERCLVTEYVQGRNFQEAIDTGRRAGFQQVHTLGRIVAKALAVVHAKGLVHGSIQPSNVMVASGVIKVADLGLGRLAGSLVVSQGYRPPEGGLDAAGDLYALSAVMYHLLTGTHPHSHAQGVGLPLPSRLAPGVPEPMDKLLIRGLHPRRELRPSSADAILADLRDMVKIG
jgi:serine/threonine-protein kinase